MHIVDVVEFPLDQNVASDPSPIPVRYVNSPSEMTQRGAASPKVEEDIIRDGYVLEAKRSGSIAAGADPDLSFHIQVVVHYQIAGTSWAAVGRPFVADARSAQKHVVAEDHIVAVTEVRVVIEDCRSAAVLAVAQFLHEPSVVVVDVLFQQD